MPETNADISAEEKANKAASSWYENQTNHELCQALIGKIVFTDIETRTLKHIFKAGYVQAMEDDAMTALLASTGGE